VLKSAKRVLGPVAQALFPSAMKRRAELKHWQDRYGVENGSLSNSHYEPLYTTVFSLNRDSYNGKRVLDIGCGPRGSLEWADGALQRVGLDPLVNDYRAFGIDAHKMEYRAAPSHKIPFGDGHFDIVTCLNALDHVDDFEGTVAEIKRVTKRGGLFLVSVEIDHPPTAAEPIVLSKRSFQAFAPEFTTLQEDTFGTPADHMLHDGVLLKAPYVSGHSGIYVAKMQRV